MHVVVMADDDNLGGRVADFRELAQLLHQFVRRRQILQDNQIGCRRRSKHVGRGLDAAGDGAEMHPRHATIFGAGLHRGQNVFRLAEGLYRNARQRAHLFEFIGFAAGVDQALVAVAVC